MSYFRGELIPEDFVYPDEIHEALRSRNDIYRLLVPENPLLEACVLLHQIGTLINAYNSVVENKIRAAGFHQFPKIEGVPGSDLAENGRSDPGGYLNIDFRYIADICAEPPKPLHSYFLKEEQFQREVQAHAASARARQAKKVATIAQRLGRVPEEWVCVYCSRPGTPNNGPDGRVWHVDHAYPRVFGGDNRQDNLVLSCATCNMSKGGRTEREFTRAREKNA